MNDPFVLVEGPDKQGIVVLTLNRPDKKNALSIALREEANEILERLSADHAVKVLVITGTGSCFSAGFDLAEFTNPDPDHQKQLWESSDRFHELLLRFPVPTIAAVDGIAYAGGFDLAVLCDIRIATTNAFFAHPESTFGPVVYGPLHDLVGGAVARELVLTGRKIDAETALRLGLVTEIVEQSALASRAIELAHTVARAPREILLINKAKMIARSSVTVGTPTGDL